MIIFSALQGTIQPLWSAKIIIKGNNSVANFDDILNNVSNFLWGSPNMLPGVNIPGFGDLPVLAILLLGTGLYLTIILRFMPIYRIPAAFGMLWRGRKTGVGEEGQITPFAALMTALSSTVGELWTRKYPKQLKKHTRKEKLGKIPSVIHLW